MTFMSKLRSVGAVLVAGAKACVGIPTVNAEPVSKEDSLAYSEFFDHDYNVALALFENQMELYHRQQEQSKARYKRTTTASRREAQRKLDAKRMMHVSVPVTMEDKLAVSWFGERVWNNRIRAKGSTYYKSVVL